MSSPDWPGLKAEVTKPAYNGLSAAQVVAAINAPGATAAVPGSYLAEGGILRVLGPTTGDAFLSGIEAAAAQAGPLQSLLNRVIRIVRDTAGGGIDFGNAATWAVLDQLQTASVVAADSVSALKAYGSAPGPSIAQTLGFPPITTSDLAAARS